MIINVTITETKCILKTGILFMYEIKKGSEINIWTYEEKTI